MGSNCCKGDASRPIRSNSSIYSRSRAGASLDDRFTVTDDSSGVRLTVSAAQTGDSGVYTLQASNAAGSDTSRVRLEVSADEAPTGDDPPTFLRRLQDLTVKVGTRTRFLVEILSSTECKVTWYRNERRLLEAERVSLARDGNFWCADVAAVSVDDAGRWTCTAENVGGRASCSAHLNVLVPKAYKRPEFVEELRALLTEQGTVSLECKVVGVPTPVLRWFKDSCEIKAGDVFALTANAEDPTSLGTYTCEAVNCMGRAYSSSKVHVVGRGSREGSARPSSSGLTPEPPPIFTRELEDQFAKICEHLTLSCHLVVPPWPRSVVWYNKEGKVEPSERYHVLEDGAGGYLLEIPSAEWPDEGEWKCVATSNAGRVGISTCYVTMDVPKNYRKPRFMENLQAVLTEEGLVSFECKVVGFPTPVLSWFKDGQELKPGDVYQLTGTNSLGSYCCIARNCMGQASSSAELTVEDIQNQLNEEEKLQLFSKNQAPKFVQGLKSIEAKIDEPFRFTIKVAIPPEPSVMWYRDDQPVDESNRCHLGKEERGVFYLDIQSLEFLDQAEWKCVAMNDFGHSVTSCFLKLLIPRHYKKPRFLENLQAILSEEGAVNLECKVIGVPQPVLKWYKDGEELKPGDIHRIISGQDGTCCLGTYTCEAQNCMGIAASSASLLGFDDSMKAKKKKAEEQALQRNLSLSTIHEERTSQMYDTPVGDITTMDDKGEISFSFDGKEVSVSLYETPDLTEEEALQIVEMYADQLSENITEHNVVELPPLRFVKETSTSGNLLMEAVIIDVSPDYFVSPEEDLRTEADVEDISIADENGPPQLSLDQDIDIGGENYLEKTMALLSEEKSDIPFKLNRKKSDSQKSADDYFSLSREQSISEDKKDDDTQVLSESDMQSFASAHSSDKPKSKSLKAVGEDGVESSEPTKTVIVKDGAQKHQHDMESPVVKPKRERRSSRSSRRSSSGSEKSLNKDKEDSILSKEDSKIQIDTAKNEETPIQLESIKPKLSTEEFKNKMATISNSLSKVINDVQIIEREIILKSELMSSAATASRSLEIISSLISPLSEIHSMADAARDSALESSQVSSSIFNTLPRPLKSLQQAMNLIEKCIDMESDSKTLVKKTCVAFIETCGSEVQRVLSEITSIVSKDYFHTDYTAISEISSITDDMTTVVKFAMDTIITRNLLNEASEIKVDELSLDAKHLRDTQKAVFELKGPLSALLYIAESAESGKLVDITKVKNSDVVLNDMSQSIQDLQTGLEQIETLSVKENNSSLHKYNTQIIETVMDSIVKLRSSFEQISIMAKNEDKSLMKLAVATIKENLTEISSKLDTIEINIGKFDVLQSENKLDALQKMAQILIALENNLPRLEAMPKIKANLTIFHKNLTRVLENVIESNEANKYFTFMEICDAVKRINGSIKNIDVEDGLPLASLSNTLRLIQDNFIQNVFESELNCSILSNISDTHIEIQEAINTAEEKSISMDYEEIHDFSNKNYDKMQAKIVVDHINLAIAAIENLRAADTPKEFISNIAPSLQSICPILVEIKQGVASLEMSHLEDEHLSDLSELSYAQTLATPVCDLNQNIIILNQQIIDNIESMKESGEILATLAEPLNEIQNSLVILQQEVVSQYGEASKVTEMSINLANAVQNLHSCIVMIQEHAGVEFADEISTLEDVSGIKTTADIISSDRLILPTTEETAIQQIVSPYEQEFQHAATAQALQTLNDNIIMLQQPDIIDALETLSEVSDYSSLKSIAVELGELHTGIEEILHPIVIERSNELVTLINPTKLIAIAEPLHELQQGLSVLDSSNIPIYENILELPADKIHSLIQSVSEFKEHLNKCMMAVFPVMETADSTIKIANKVGALREVCEHLKDIIEMTKATQDFHIPDKAKALELTVESLLDATDISKTIKIEQVKSITEQLYEDVTIAQEEIIQFITQSPAVLSQEAELIETIQNVENNIAVLEEYEFVDLSHVSDATCISPCNAAEIDSKSLNEIKDIVQNAIIVVKDSAKDVPFVDLMIVEDFFNTCKSEFTVLRCLITKPNSHKKIIRLIQEFNSLRNTLNSFKKRQVELNLPDDVKGCIENFYIYADECIKTVQTVLICIVESQSEILVKLPVDNIANSTEVIQKMIENNNYKSLNKCLNECAQIIELMLPHLRHIQFDVIHELNNPDLSQTKTEGSFLLDKMEELLACIDKSKTLTTDVKSQKLLEKISKSIDKHLEYKDAVGTGKNLIILKCLSDCIDVIQETALEIKVPTQKLEESNLNVVLSEMLEPLRAVHSQITNIQKQIASGVNEDFILTDVSCTESLIQTITEKHKEIVQQIETEQAVGSQDISLIIALDTEIHSMQDELKSLGTVEAAENIVKEIIKPIEDIEKSLLPILSSKIVDATSTGELLKDINSNIDTLQNAIERFVNIDVDLLIASCSFGEVDLHQSLQIATEIKRLLTLNNEELESPEVIEIKHEKVRSLYKILSAIDWTNDKIVLEGKSQLENEKFKNISLTTYQLLAELNKVIKSVDEEKIMNEGNPREIIEHIDQYIELIEIVEEVSAIIKLENIRETVDIARELRESIAAIELINQPEMGHERYSEICLEQAQLAQKLQRALSELHVQVVDCAQELAPELSTEVLQRIARVTAQLKADLIAVTGVHIAIQAPSELSLETTYSKDFLENNITDDYNLQALEEEALAKNVAESVEVSTLQSAEFIPEKGKQDQYQAHEVLDENLAVIKEDTVVVDSMITQIVESVCEDKAQEICHGENNAIESSDKVVLENVENEVHEVFDENIDIAKDDTVVIDNMVSQIVQSVCEDKVREIIHGENNAMESSDNVIVENVENKSTEEVDKNKSYLEKQQTLQIAVIEENKASSSISIDKEKEQETEQVKEANIKITIDELKQHMEKYTSHEIVEAVNELSTALDIEELKLSVDKAIELRESISISEINEVESSDRLTGDLVAQQADLAHHLQAALTALENVVLDSALELSKTEALSQVTEAAEILRANLVATIIQQTIEEPTQFKSYMEVSEDKTASSALIVTESNAEPPSDLTIQNSASIPLIEDNAVAQLSQTNITIDLDLPVREVAGESEEKNLKKLSEPGTLLKHIEDFISPETTEIIEEISTLTHFAELKDSLILAKDLKESILIQETILIEEISPVISETKTKQGKLMQELKNALSTLHIKTLDNAEEILPAIQFEALQRVSEIITHLQEHLENVSTTSLQFTDRIPESDEEDSMQTLRELLQDVTEIINKPTANKNSDDTERLKDTLDEVQTVIIKLKRDYDGANDTLNETLEDLECSVRSVQLQIHEESPPELLQDACASLQLLVNNMTELQEVNIKKPVDPINKSENVIEKCTSETDETVRLLELASNVSIQEGNLIDVVKSLDSLIEAIKLIKLSFLDNAEILIEKGIDITQNLINLEDKVFSLEKDLSEASLGVQERDSILTAIHSVYGSISNMRSAICSIQKRYMFENYGKPSEILLHAIKNAASISNIDLEHKKNWKTFSKSLRKVLSHFEDIKFYINLDKTARLPSDAAFTKIILNELKSNIVEIIVPKVHQIGIDMKGVIQDSVDVVEQILAHIEMKTAMDVKEKIPIFKKIATKMLELTHFMKTEMTEICVKNDILQENYNMGPTGTDITENNASVKINNVESEAIEIIKPGEVVSNKSKLKFIKHSSDLENPPYALVNIENILNDEEEINKSEIYEMASFTLKEIIAEAEARIENMTHATVDCDSDYSLAQEKELLTEHKFDAPSTSNEVIISKFPEIKEISDDDILTPETENKDFMSQEQQTKSEKVEQEKKSHKTEAQGATDNNKKENKEAHVNKTKATQEAKDKKVTVEQERMPEKTKQEQEALVIKQNEERENRIKQGNSDQEAESETKAENEKEQHLPMPKDEIQQQEIKLKDTDQEEALAELEPERQETIADTEKIKPNMGKEEQAALCKPKTEKECQKEQENEEKEAKNQIKPIVPVNKNTKEDHEVGGKNENEALAQSKGEALEANTAKEQYEQEAEVKIEEEKQEAKVQSKKHLQETKAAKEEQELMSTKENEEQEAKAKKEKDGQEASITMEKLDAKDAEEQAEVENMPGKVIEEKVAKGTKEKEEQEAKAKTEMEEQEAQAKKEKIAQKAKTKEDKEKQEAKAKKEKEEQDAITKMEEEAQEAKALKEKEDQEAKEQIEKEEQEAKAKKDEEEQEAKLLNEKEEQEVKKEKGEQDAKAKMEVEAQEAKALKEKEDQEAKALKKKEEQEAKAKKEKEEQDAIAKMEEEAQEAKALKEKEDHEAKAQKETEEQEAKAVKEREKQETKARKEKEEQEAKTTKEKEEQDAKVKIEEDAQEALKGNEDQEAKALKEKEEQEAKAKKEREEQEAKARKEMEEQEAKAKNEREEEEAKALKEKEEQEVKAMKEKEEQEAKTKKEREEQEAKIRKESEELDARAKIEEKAQKAKALKEKEDHEQEAKATKEKEEQEAKTKKETEEQEAKARKESEEQDAKPKIDEKAQEAKALKETEDLDQEAKEHEAVATKEKEEQEAKAVKERKKQETEAKKEKEEQEAKATKEKEEQDAKAKIEEDAQEAKALKEKEDQEAKALKEKEEQEAKAKKEREQQEAKARNEREEQEAKAKKEREEEEARAIKEKEEQEVKAMKEKEEQEAKTKKEMEEQEAEARKESEELDAKAKIEEKAQEAKTLKEKEDHEQEAKATKETEDQEAKTKKEREEQEAKARKESEEQDPKAKIEEKAQEGKALEGKEDHEQETKATKEKEQQEAKVLEEKEEQKAKAKKEKEKQDAKTKMEQAAQVAKTLKHKEDQEAKAQKEKEEQEAKAAKEREEQETKAKKEKEEQGAKATKEKEEQDAKTKMEEVGQEAKALKEKEDQEAKAQKEKKEQEGKAKKEGEEQEAKARKKREDKEAKAKKEREEQEAKARKEKEEQVAKAMEEKVEQDVKAKIEEKAQEAKSLKEKEDHELEAKEQEAKATKVKEEQEAKAQNEREEQEAKATKEREEQEAKAAKEKEQQEGKVLEVKEEQVAKAMEEKEEQDVKAKIEEKAQEAKSLNEKEDHEQEAKATKEKEEQEAKAKNEKEEQEAKARKEREEQESKAKKEREEREAKATNKKKKQEAKELKEKEDQEAKARKEKEEQASKAAKEREEQETKAKIEKEEQGAKASKEKEEQDAKTKMEEEAQEAKALKEKEDKEAKAQKEKKEQEVKAKKKGEEQEAKAKKDKEKQYAKAKMEEAAQAANILKEKEDQDALKKKKEQEAKAAKEREKQEDKAKKQNEEKEAKTKKEKEDQETMAQKEKEEQEAKANNEKKEQVAKAMKEKEEQEAKAKNERDEQEAKARKEREEQEYKANKEREEREAKATKEKEKHEAKVLKEKEDQEIKARKEKEEQEAKAAKEREEQETKAKKEEEEQEAKATKEKEEQDAKTKMEDEEQEAKAKKEKEKQYAKAKMEEAAQAAKILKEKEDQEAQKEKEEQDAKAAKERQKQDKAKKQNEEQEAKTKKEKEDQEAMAQKKMEEQEATANKERKEQKAKAKMEVEAQEAKAAKEKKDQDAKTNIEKEEQEAMGKKEKEEQTAKAKMEEEAQEANAYKENKEQEAKPKNEREEEEAKARKEREEQETKAKKEREEQEAKATKEKEEQDAKAKMEEAAQAAETSKEKEDQEAKATKKKEELDAKAKIEEVAQAAKTLKEKEDSEAKAQKEKERQEAKASKKREKQEAKAKKENDEQQVRAQKEKEEQEAKAKKEKEEQEAKDTKEREEQETKAKKEREEQDARAEKEKEEHETKAKKEKEEQEAKAQKEKEDQEAKVKKIKENEEAQRLNKKKNQTAKAAKEREEKEAKAKKEKEESEAKAETEREEQETKAKKEREDQEAKAKKDKDEQETKAKKEKEEQEAKAQKEKEEQRAKAKKEKEEQETKANKEKEEQEAQTQNKKKKQHAKAVKEKEEKVANAKNEKEEQEVKAKKEKEQQEAKVKKELEKQEAGDEKQKEQQEIKAKKEKEDQEPKATKQKEEQETKAEKENEKQESKAKESKKVKTVKETKKHDAKAAKETEKKEVMAKTEKEEVEAMAEKESEEHETKAKKEKVEQDAKAKKQKEQQETKTKKEREDQEAMATKAKEEQESKSKEEKKAITVNEPKRHDAKAVKEKEEQEAKVHKKKGEQEAKARKENNEKDYQETEINNDISSHKMEVTVLEDRYIKEYQYEPRKQENERNRFIDHNHKDYTSEFLRPTNYRERTCHRDKPPEDISLGKNATVYKAQSIILDAHLRSSVPPLDKNDPERRERLRSKALSETRSIFSERRPGLSRDSKRKPVFSTYLTDRTAVEGSRVKLTCSVLSSSEPQTTWYKNGVILDNKLKYRTKMIDGLITLEVLNAVPSDSAEYSCTVNNDNGTVSTSSNLKVYPSFEASPIPPTFTRSIRDTYHLAENELVLECRIRGQPLPTITWLKDDKPVTNNDRYQAYYLADGVCRLAISSPTSEDSGKYTCKAENSMWTDQITHVVSFTGRERRLSPNLATIERSRFNRHAMESRRPHFTNVLTDYQVAHGGTIGLQVEIRGSPTRVEWLREGRAVTEVYRNARTFVEQGLYTLALSDVTEKESGMYTCRAWSSHGNVDMNAAITVVQPNEMEGKPAIIVGRPEKDILISVGEDINISFRVQGEPKPKVVFMKGIRDITNNQRACKMTSDDYVKFTLKRSVVSDAGTYCILARNAYGCDRAFVTVVVRQRASSENLISDWTYPMDDSALTIAERKYKSVPERIPGEPTVVDGGNNWVSLAWPKPDQQSAAPVLAYKVEGWLLGKEGGARWVELGITPLNSFDAFNLKQGEEYHFRVTPRNRYGWGESVQTSTPVGIGLAGDRPEFIDILPGQLKVLAGETANLSCSIKGKPLPEVVWMKNGHEVEEQARMTTLFNGHDCCLIIKDINSEDEGRYSCEASNVHGRASTYARLAVVTDRLIWEADAKLKRERSADALGEFPPQFTMRLRDRRVQATFPVRLTCQVVGCPQPALTWYKDGQEVTLDSRRNKYQDEHFHTLEIAPTTLEDGGVYEAMARNSCGAVSCRCGLVVDKGIRAYVAPEFCCGLEPLYRLAEGDELRISAVVEAYPSVGVTWYRDGVRLRPSRRAVMTLDRDGQIELALASVTPRDAGVYTCTASNEVGRASTSGKVEVVGGELSENRTPPVVINTPDTPYSREPMFTRKPRSSEAREGDTVIIECEVVGDPKPDVYWLRDFLKPDYYRDASHFKRVGEGPEYRFEIPHAKLDYTGAYSVVARNAHGEAKAIISLQILAKDPSSCDDAHNVRYGRVEVIPRFERNLTDLLSYDGDAVEFECHVTGNPEPDIRWFHYHEVIRDCPDFESSFEEGTARLKIKQVAAEDEGTYTCEASNTLGKATSSACLVVYPPGEPNTLSQRLRRPPALLSGASTPRSTPRSTPARSVSRTPGPDTRRLCSPSRQMAPSFYTYPFNKVVEEGDSVTFQCAVKGLPAPWASWDKDGIIITPSARITIREKDELMRILEIEQVTIEDVGIYRITLENEYGRAEASARLEVITQKGKFYGGLRAGSASPRRCLSYRRRTPSSSRQD